MKIITDKSRAKFIITTSVIALILLLESPLSWNYYDVNYFVTWDYILKNYGIFHVYKYSTKVAYPPLSIFIFVSMYELALSFSTVSTALPMIRLFVKIPLIASIVAIAYILYRYYGWKSTKWLYLSYGLYSTVFGYQFDLITALGIVLTLIFIYRKKNYLLAGMSFSLSLLTKHLTIILIPLIFYDIYSNRKLRGILEFLMGLLIIGVPTTVPFLIYSFKEFIEKVLLFHSNRYPQDLSIYAIPVYYYAYVLHRINDIPSYLKWIWIPIFIAAYTITVTCILKKARISEECGYIRYAIILLLSILLNKIGNNPYYVWPLPLLAIIMAKYGEKKKLLKTAYIITPIISMFVYPFLTLFSAAVVNSGYFIVEDLKFYNAYMLYALSFVGSPNTFAIKFLELNREYLFSIYKLLYDNIWLVIAILTALYLSLLAYMIRYLTTLHKSTCTECCYIHKKARV